MKEHFFFLSSVTEWIFFSFCQTCFFLWKILHCSHICYFGILGYAVKTIKVSLHFNFISVFPQDIRNCSPWQLHVVLQSLFWLSCYMWCQWFSHKLKHRGVCLFFYLRLNAFKSGNNTVGSVYFYILYVLCLLLITGYFFFFLTGRYIHTCYMNFKSREWILNKSFYTSL